MAYPLLISSLTARRRLVEQQVYLSRLWPEVTSRCAPSFWESRLSRFLLPLPVDSRYDEEAINRLAHLVRKALERR